MGVDLQKYEDYKKQMLIISIIPEFFLSCSLLILLIGGFIITFSSKYNYLIWVYKDFTSLILIWLFLLLTADAPHTAVTSYFVVDYLSSYCKIFLTLGLLACIHIDSSRKKKSFEYYILSLTSLLGLFLLSSATDLLSVYLSLELTTFSFYVLTLSQRASAFSVEAALKYFVLGALSSSLLIFGASIVYGVTGTINLKYHSIITFALLDPSVLLLVQCSFLCFSFGLLFKLGAAPFHIWLPDVYEGAPTSVTIIFAVLPKIALFAVFVRLLIATKLIIWLFFLALFAFLSIFVGSFHALAQTKLKRVLAFSGISHVGYALLGLACGTLEGFISCLFYILIYILTAGFLWGLSLCLKIDKSRTMYLTDIVQLLKSNPSLGLISILVVFSLAGIPPFGGFFAKFAIFLACIEVSYYSAVFIGVFSSALAILYYLRVIKIISCEEVNWTKSRKLKHSHVLTLGILGFTLIFFGFYGDLLYLIVNAIVLGALPS